MNEWGTTFELTTNGWVAVNRPCDVPVEETVKVFEYIVVNVEADPSEIVAGPTCIVAECADEARVAAGQSTASLGIPASSLKVLVRSFAWSRSALGCAAW